MKKKAPATLGPGSGAAPNAGTRRFQVNGKDILIRGGGWSPDLFQRMDRGQRVHTP